MDKENQFIDFKKWLQEKLDAIQQGFKVSNERCLDGDFEGEVVVSALSGVPYEESANIPYQIDVFSSDVDNTQNILNTLCKTVSNVEFTQIVKTGTRQEDGREVDVFAEHRITPYLNTPVIMEKDIPNGSQHFVRFVIFASMLIFYDVCDIKAIEIDGEKLNILNGSLNYGVEPMSNRISGQPLNVSKKKAATVSINFEMISKGGVFNNKLFKIATGKMSGNTGFDVKVTLSDNESATLKMFVTNSSRGTARGKLPSLNVTMFLYDNRGENNNA